MMQLMCSIQAKEIIDIIPKHDVLLIAGECKNSGAGSIFEQIKMADVDWKRSMNSKSNSLGFAVRTRLLPQQFIIAFCG